MVQFFGMFTPKRGVCHVEINVPNYEQAIAFYDQMFGWLGYKSFSTLGIDYVGTYYAAFPHSYIGVQPSKDAALVDTSARHVGINHIALWAKSRHEVDLFYDEFLKPAGVTVTDMPASYPNYTPTYYAVFFLDPYGIRWELAYVPMVPSPLAVARWWKRLTKLKKVHPEWERHPFFEAIRQLPRSRKKK